MNRSITISLLAITIFMSCTKRSNTALEEAASASLPDGKDLIDRGAYLVTVAACNECHSPKVFTKQGRIPDPERLLSGHPQDEALPVVARDALANRWALWNEHSTAVVGPWGISFAANLTPDDTGIGNWTFEQFEKAIRHGKYKGLEGNRELLPPMPWRGYSLFTDDDLKAIFAYLKSLTPVSNLVPAPIYPTEIR